MNESINKLMRKLDEDQISPWLEEMKLGKPIYEHVFKAMNLPSTTERQICNGLQVLFRLRHHGDENAYFQLLVEQAESSRQRVRSTAVMLIIGLLKLSRNPGHTSVDRIDDSFTLNLIKKSIQVGLDDKVTCLANKFLENRTSRANHNTFGANEN